MHKYITKVASFIVTALASVFLLSACTTYVDSGSHYVAPHYDRAGYHIPGHYAGGGSGWVNGHYNRLGGWVPGHWR